MVSVVKSLSTTIGEWYANRTLNANISNEGAEYYPFVYSESNPKALIYHISPSIYQNGDIWIGMSINIDPSVNIYLFYIWIFIENISIFVKESKQKGSEFY